MLSNFHMLAVQTLQCDSDELNIPPATLWDEGLGAQIFQLINLLDIHNAACIYL